MVVRNEAGGGRARRRWRRRSAREGSAGAVEGRVVVGGGSGPPPSGAVVVVGGGSVEAFSVVGGSPGVLLSFRAVLSLALSITGIGGLPLPPRLRANAMMPTSSTRGTVPIRARRFQLRGPAGALAAAGSGGLAG